MSPDGMGFPFTDKQDDLFICDNPNDTISTI